MGIFSLFGKRKREPQPAQGTGDEWVTVQVKKSELEAFNDMMDFADMLSAPAREKARREAEEEERRLIAELEEQRARRMDALEGHGVDVDCITLDECCDDLFSIASTLCGIDLSALGPSVSEVIDWKPLTRSGKVPKCVATYNTHWDLRNGGLVGGLVTCEVSYLADGTPYAAWINDLRGSGTFYKIKTVDGKLALVAATPA